MKIIDLDNWSRRQHFTFFSSFEEPLWGTTTVVDVTRALQASKNQNIPFFIYYLYQCVRATNAIENLRYRINPDGKVVLYDHIGASATVLRANETFGFTFIPYQDKLSSFKKEVEKEITRVKSTKDLFPPEDPIDVIHYSAVPWLNFTSLSHARSFKKNDGVPKISFGKYYQEGQHKKMAISIHVHHGLVDGIHIGRFINRFQELLDV